MKLNGDHKSIWVATAGKPEFEPLIGDLTVDCAIVGGGITGLTAALLLKKAGKKVAVLEQHDIGSGTSGMTTAHITAQIDADYSVLERKFNAETVAMVRISMTQAIDTIDRIIRDNSIDCDFERVPGYYYTENPDDAEFIREEYEASKRAGMKVRMVQNLPLPFPTIIGFSCEDQAQFHALKYLSDLAKAFHGDGCSIFANTHVREIKDGSPCYIDTDRGQIIARDVIMATHIPIGLNVVQTEIPPYKTYVMAVKLKNDLQPGLYWDTAEPYNYIRRLKVGDGYVVLIGGKDHKTAHDSEEEAYRNLEAFIRARFDVTEFLNYWSAQFYVPADGLPLIGPIPGGNHIFTGTGYNGDGMTFGTLAGMMLSDMIAEKPNPYADLYKPSRLQLKGIGQWLGENIDVAGRMIKDRLASGDSSELSEIPNGEGRVVRIGTTQVAAYRDDNGGLHTHRAICPHMKCVVRWNNAEKSWDCPCHGSRFKIDGSIIEGPALSGLAMIDVSEIKAKKKE